MRYALLLVLLAGCKSPTVVVPEPTTIERPIRTQRDTVIVYDPDSGENRP